jgi:hypothetical protein
MLEAYTYDVLSVNMSFRLSLFNVGRAIAKGDCSASGGRSWWAHFEIARVNSAPTFLYKKFEDAREVGAIVGVRAAAALWP